MVSVLFAFAPVFSMLYWIMLVCFGNDIYETTFGGILHNIAFHHGVGATSMLLAMCNSITLYAHTGGRPGRSHHMQWHQVVTRKIKRISVYFVI